MRTDPADEPSLPTSVRDAQSRADYKGKHGWCAAIAKDIDRIAAANYRWCGVFHASESRLYLEYRSPDKQPICLVLLAFLPD
jgi:hypothetical protein